ncbi:MAG: RNase adaptor protein RapZ, partial [Ruminococcus sp.]|nr:RNase adaptor protein RapZ [Ruminococcus sp.]
MQVLIVTGMSGSGKSSVMDVMEDIGYYCIDNIPPALIGKFVDLCRKSETNISKIAVAVDIRTGDMFAEIFHSWQILKDDGDVDVKVLFIEANDEVLIKRYKETRRKHPLDEKFNGNLHEAIKYEWRQLSQLREIADYYIETSQL